MSNDTNDVLITLHLHPRLRNVKHYFWQRCEVLIISSITHYMFRVWEDSWCSFNSN